MSFKKNALVAYFALAFAFTWGMVGLILLRIVPLEVGFLIATFGPTVGAALVCSFSGETGSLRGWLSGYGRWRVSPVAYLVALSPLVVATVGVAVSTLVGGDVAAPETTFSAGFLVSTFVVSLLIGPLGEEGGWRGFALPRLQRRFGALISTVILSLIWIVWHLPVWLLPDSPMSQDPFFLWAIYCVALTVVITVAYNLSGGSILVAMVGHFSANFAASFVMGLGLLSVARFFATVPLCLLLWAAILIVVFGPNRLGAPATEVVDPQREHRAIGGIPG